MIQPPLYTEDGPRAPKGGESGGNRGKRSKDKLTIYREESTRDLPNNEKGFQKLLKLVDANTTVALESTGVYSIRIINFLLSRGVKVKVLNSSDYEGV